MKKVKIMLASIAILAVVGGALAFKAKFNEPFCYTTAYTTIGDVWTCPEVPACKAINLTLQDNQSEFFHYCTTEFNEGCAGRTDCLEVTTVQKDQ